MHRRLLVSVALAVAIAAPAVALGAVARPRGVTVLGDPVVHVTPDRVAQIPFFLRSCSNATACLSSMALYGRGGQRLTGVAPVSFLPSVGESFPGLRLTGAAWRALGRTKRLGARLIVKLAGGARQLLGYETLLAPAPGQARWCSGPLRPLVPPCSGPFR